MAKWVKKGFSQAWPEMLVTGKRQSEAIRLYEQNGYRRIPNYGQYAEVENSLRFEKIIN
jgi:putative acetyltransferase